MSHNVDGEAGARPPPRKSDPPELLERDDDLVAADRLLELADRGESRALVIEGRPGLGKTSLCRAIAARARAQGFDVLPAAGVAHERHVPFGVARQLLVRRLSRDGPERDRLLRGAAGHARAVLDAVPPAAVPIDQHAVRLGLTWLTAELGDAAPLLVVVDDAQWGDAPSIDWLSQLASRLGELRALVLVATRDGDRGCIDDVMGRPTTHLRRLQPLSLDAVGVLAAAVLGRPPSAAQLAHWHERTGGNPFLVDVLLRTMPEPDGGGWGGASSPELSAWVRRRLDALSWRERRLAEAAAVLGAGTTLRQAAVLAELASDGAGSLLEGAERLRSAAILSKLSPLRFEHPLVEEAVRAGLAPDRRARLHRRAAALLAEGGEPISVVAHQLVAVPPLGDEWVAGQLALAVENALAQGDPARAEGLASRALDEPAPVGLVGRLHHLRGVARARLGSSAAEGDLRLALRLLERPADRAEVLAALVSGLLFAGRDGDAADVLTPTLAALEADEPDLAMAVDAAVLSASRHSASAALWNADRLRRWRPRLSSPDEPAGPAGRALLANLATQVALDGGRAADAADLAARALAGHRLIGEHAIEDMTVYQPIWVLTGAERLEEAEAAASAALAAASRRGSAGGFALAALFGSYVALARGDLAEADGRASVAREAAATSLPGWFAAPAVAAGLIDVLVERNDLAGARQHLAGDGWDGQLGDSTPLRLLLLSRGRMLLAAGDPGGAAADLCELVDREERWHVLASHLAPAHAWCALALAAAGDMHRARCRAARALDDARAWGTGRSLGLALRACAAPEPPGRAVELLRDAVAAFERSPAQLDRAWAHCDLGAGLARQGQRHEAQRWLRSALDVAVASGAHRLTDVARARLMELGYRPRRAAVTGPAALTGSERRVAELAAQGLSNRDIAQALFVTQRTIEVHLTNTYRKLAIGSRRQLANALAPRCRRDLGNRTRLNSAG